MNAVKEKLSRGEIVLGHMVFEFFSHGIAKLLENAGFEFVMYDMEHTGLDLGDVARLLREARSANIVRLVRVPDSLYHLISRPLDLGAQGVMVPRVETAEQAAAIVSAVKYPPVGRRGAAFGFAHDDYTVGDVAAKIGAINQSTLVIVQIETALGLENVDEIVRTPGVDVAWVGHFDLSISLGIPAAFASSRFIEASRRVSEACRAAGVAAGYNAATVEDALEWTGRGYTCIGLGSDVRTYPAAAAILVSSARERLRAGGRGPSGGGAR